MEATTALDRLGALAQETRLALFRRLVQQGPEGLAAGEIAAALTVPAPTLSFHLAQLERAGLVLSRREGRSIRYAAELRRDGGAPRLSLRELLPGGRLLPDGQPTSGAPGRPERKDHEMNLTNLNDEAKGQ